MPDTTQDVTSLYPLDWIDEYVERIREYIFVREEDCLLIKVPNEAYKLNPSGVRILRRLLDGESVIALWDLHSRTPEVRQDLYQFFVGLKRVLQGCIDERHLPEAVQFKPFSLGFSTLPVLSEVALTYRCNLRCQFCYAGCSCTKRADTEGEMTTGEVCRVLRVVREKAQIPSVSFTGGEPVLRKDLSELVRFARHELGLRVNLITNGTLVDRGVATDLKRAGLNSVQVSLEAPDPATHDELTQVRGSFQSTVEAIRQFRECGVIVHTNTTLNRKNVMAASDMPASVQSLGLKRFSMNMVIPAGSSRVAHSDVNLRYTEMPEIITRIQSEASRCGVEFMWYSPTPVCVFNPIQHQLGNKGCAACDGLLSVSPQGNVLPCSSWPESVGNLLEDEFTTVWRSARARWLRAKEFAPPLCHGCGDFALCQGGCPLYWKHFGHEELEEYGAPYVAATL